VVSIPHGVMGFFTNLILTAAVGVLGRRSLLYEWELVIFPGRVKTVGAYGWQPCYIDVPIVYEFSDSQPLGALRFSPRLKWVALTFMLYTEVTLWSQTQECINILEFVNLSFSIYKCRLITAKIYEQVFLNFSWCDHEYQLCCLPSKLWTCQTYTDL